MKKTRSWPAGVLLVTVLLSGAPAEVRLNTLFTDHMVIQRNQPIRVWGRADPGEIVTVSLAGNEASGTAGEDGRWEIELPALATGEDLTLTAAAHNTITLTNVIVGDVWLCSGQSNMAFPLAKCLGAAEDIKSADFPKIRYFHVRTCPSVYLERNTAVASPWTPCSPKSAPRFTGAGFYFAREVHARTGVPIGLLHSSKGGTIIEEWMPGTKSTARAVRQYTTGKQPAELDRVEKGLAALRAALKAGTLHDSDGGSVPPPKVSVKALTEWEDWIPRMREAMKKQRYVDESGRRIPDPPKLRVTGTKDKSLNVYTGVPGSGYFPANAPCWWFQCRAACLYRGMIHPLTRFPIKGAIWYQGESNGLKYDSASAYAGKQATLVQGWRKQWGMGGFPFYYVQIPGWHWNRGKWNPGPGGGGGWVPVREAQLKSMSEPNTGMIVTMDVGDSKDLHPENKYDIGVRLARWALARDYGFKDIVVSGPIYREMKIEGETIRLFFDHAESGLMAGIKKGRAPVIEDKGGKLQRFAIGNKAGTWAWADAKIEGKTVVVSSPEVKGPVAVRYAYVQDPAGANLYNREGLPASPFRTDGR